MRRALLATTLVLTWNGCSDEPEEPTGPISSVALSEREETDGTRFVRLDPDVCGVVHTNELRDENNLPYIYSGAGVAIGDYDQDGLPDVYMVSQDGPNRLFRQVAPLRFEDVTESAGGLDGGDVWGTAAAFADVDGDGDLDLYVCTTSRRRTCSTRTRGDGTFVERAGPSRPGDHARPRTGCGVRRLRQRR